MYKFLVAITIFCSTFCYGVRGPKKHIKRLASPRHWMLDKMSGIFAPKAFVINDIKDAEGNTYMIAVYPDPFQIKIMLQVSDLEIAENATKEKDEELP